MKLLMTLLVPLLVCISMVWQSTTLRQQSQEAQAKSISLNQSMPMLSPEAIHQVGATLARAFPPQHHNLSWCTNEKYPRPLPKTNGTCTHPFTSLLYVKVPKSASSTVASVVNRIARKNGCSFRNGHHNGILYNNRNTTASFLLSSIRDPASRAISRIFFYQVSQHGLKPTDKNIIKALNTTDRQYGATSPGRGGFQLNYMSTFLIPNWSAWQPDSPTHVIDPQQVLDNVKQTIQAYNFIVVVERMDESLVVLQMLLGVNVGDILTLDSKIQGMYQFHSRKKCFKIVKSNVTSQVKEYLSSSLWYTQNYGDYVLHAAANASLDQTIDALGRSRVEQQVSEYRALKARINVKCASSAIYPCSVNGVDQRKKSRKSCYTKDQGCGYECIDNEVARVSVKKD